MTSFLKELFKIGPGFRKKAAIVIVTEILTGLFLGFLLEVNLGTDPCSFMMATLSQKSGISFGNLQVIVNVALLVIVLGASRLRYLGIGTFANMILIGYSADFMRFVIHRTMPKVWFTTYPIRAVIFALALAAFILCCAVYMNMDAGLAPYDATPMIIGRSLPAIPFMVIRMCWDFGVILIGVLLGGTPTIGSLIMAVALGPVITAVGRQMRKSIVKGA